MGLIERVLGWKVPGQANDRDESPYRCIACGAGYDRPHTECPECRGPYITATTDDADLDRR